MDGVTLSFLDRYPRAERRLRALRGTSLEPWCPERAEEARGPLARDLGEIAAGFGLEARSCAEAGLDDTVVIVGLNDRFQIWSREKWAARRAEQRALAKAGMAQIGALKLAAQMKLAGGGS